MTRTSLLHDAGVFGDPCGGHIVIVDGVAQCEACGMWVDGDRAMAMVIEEDKEKEDEKADV